MAQDGFEKIEWVFQATKLGRHLREVTGPPPEDLPEKMKEILKRLEKAETSKG